MNIVSSVSWQITWV